MNIEYTGRPRPVVPRLRTLAERKLEKLGRLLHGTAHAHVVLDSEGRRHRAEVTIQSRQLSLAASGEGTGAANVLTSVIEKLTRQAQKHVGRRRETKRRRGSRETALWSGVLSPGTPNDSGPRIIQSRRFVVKPMTVDEAALEVEGSDDGFVVFRDSGTDRVSVLYQRRDGNLGLIEPEG